MSVCVFDDANLQQSPKEKNFWGDFFNYFPKIEFSKFTS